jgi:hypothetical protein
MAKVDFDQNQKVKMANWDSFLMIIWKICSLWIGFIMGAAIIILISLKICDLDEI